MYTINFNSYDHNFCESTIYSHGQHPEYLNSLSSLFITFIGINGLTKPNINFLLTTLYSSFVVNGITSCFYHYYNTIGWGLLDRFSMILIALASVNLFTNKIYMILLIKRWNNIILINRMISILVVTYFTILFTIAGLHMETLFNMMFGLFLGSLVIFMYLINQYYIMLQIPYKLISYGWRGIKYIALSGIFWILTENLCNQYSVIKYLFGHVWWHIFVSYGGYLISLIPQYMYMMDIQQRNRQSILLAHDRFRIPYLIFENQRHIPYSLA